jgi:hypothetical protein
MLYGLYKYAYLDCEEEGEDGHKQPEGSLHSTHTDTRYGSLNRQQTVDNPWLTTHLGNNPSSLTRKIY